MVLSKKIHQKERHYFVDEAGDLVLFSRRGKIIVGEEGCSKYFILGTVLIENQQEVRRQLTELRTEISNDVYLSKIPSVNKSKIAFHAKDDCPEIRMQVYKLVQKLDVKAYGIVRRKEFLVKEVQEKNRWYPKYRYTDTEIYDDCVKRLFKDRLHIAETNHVIFSKRGKAPRNAALTLAIQKAHANFEKSTGKVVSSVHNIFSNYPSNEGCLQVIDYLLWAVQRMYEKHEDRYWDFVHDKFRRVIDLDDKRLKEYGIYYDERNLLSLDKIKNSLKG